MTPSTTSICGFPAASLRAGHDVGALSRSYAPRTVKTYAVKWREPDGQTFIGRLVLGTSALRLDGRLRGGEEPPVNRQFGYEELRTLRIGGRGRLEGRPALVVERPDGTYLVADAGMGAPIVQELVERLTGLISNAAAKPQEVCAQLRMEARGTSSTLNSQATERKGGTP